MAAAAVPAPAIDLKTQTSYSIRLGASILKPADSRRFASVRYNHKPRLDASKNISCTISSVHNDDSKLILREGDDKYSYSGKSVEDGDHYVLFSTGSSKDKEVVLERLSGDHQFNLVKTSTETDTRKLVQRYPQLRQDDEDGDDLYGDEDGAEEPVDPENPFDYRNHLKAQPKKPRDDNRELPRSTTGTPQVQSRAASSTPVSRPTNPVKRPGGPLVAQKKRKAQEEDKLNPKRVKAGTEPPQPAPSSKPAPRADIPKVRVDRKASLRRPSLDDLGELILENETPVTKKSSKQPSAMSLALSGQLGQGPISLRSAASSPASRIASPLPQRPKGMEEGEEFEIGESSPEASSKKPAVRASPEDQRDADAEEEDADADADVEDLELPSPAQTHRKSVSATTVTGGDDDDDLDKQLALAMAEEDDAFSQPVGQAESEEESEEE